MLILIVLALAAIGCGGSGSSPTAPSTNPGAVTPTLPTGPPAFTGRVTNTVTGAPVFGYEATIAGGRLLVSAPGYVPRDTSASVSAVDLIPESAFDVDFYRMFARGSLDGALQPLRVLRQAPSFYMEVEGARGLSEKVAQDLEQVARRVVPQLTGGMFQVTRWETGPSPRPRQNGWIVIERRDLAPGTCGTAFVGATAGQVLLDNDTTCSLVGVFAHELGHAFGFWHVDVKTSMMAPRATTNNVATPPPSSNAATPRSRTSGCRATWTSTSTPRGRTGDRRLETGGLARPAQSSKALSRLRFSRRTPCLLWPPAP